jgi:hypothetical protein
LTTFADAVLLGLLGEIRGRSVAIFRVALPKLLCAPRIHWSTSTGIRVLYGRALHGVVQLREDPQGASDVSCHGGGVADPDVAALVEATAPEPGATWAVQEAVFKLRMGMPTTLDYGDGRYSKHINV